ncbi:hypothetical protein T06_4220 [Trichinella sp. T6]|nr:hypothetical protein T06_4220 [Trichinella sp. T6]
MFASILQRELKRALVAQLRIELCFGENRFNHILESFK